MITIIEAKTKKQLKEFIKFPFQLYKDNPYWVPPLISDEMEAFDQNKNPVFKNAEAYFYLAYCNNKIVGRIAAIINWDEVRQLGKKKTRFGWFEVIDDVEVTELLIGKVTELGLKNHMDHIEGPMGFSNLDKVGCLTEGFDQLSTAIGWYTPPYYVTHFEKLGFKVEKKYIESEFSFEGVAYEPIKKAADLVKKRYGFKSINFTNTKEIEPYVDRMFELFNKTYVKLQSFVAISKDQIDYFKKKYIPFVNPEYIKFVEDINGDIIGFAIVMPNYAYAQQAIKGKLFPFGFLKMLHAKKNNKEAVFYLIGIAPEYQSKGVTAVIFEEYHKVFTTRGITKCIRTPELEENMAIQNLWKNFNPKITKKRCTFSRSIS
ncbi:GTP cyclohydrolase [Flavobacterium oreochromis]|uniref:GTP cyclohydrolase n=1 Tax=Flavobacterium oreochromis TaxID=2906078 RepID=A0ABW8P8P9_9FLAO|nr:GTP cyclohydrolase [Flavobacterium oreochromis]OWP77752.1 GTP cyclohydrolase [Flavobacterium oreochromis]